MKQIDNFVDTVYKKASGDKKEIQELKLEMKNHLLEAVNELKAEGKTEEEAIDIAIERFGGKEEMRTVVAQLFKAQKTFAKWLIFVGITILLVSTIIFSYFINIGNERSETQAEIAYKIGDFVENNAEVTQSTEDKIEQLLNDANYIKQLTVYLNGDRSNPVYEFGNNFNQPFPLVYSDLSYGGGNSFVEIEVLDYRAIGIYSLFFGITCFSVLFILWVIINIYHRRKKQFVIQ
ncbi:hypothetical protein CEH05_18260 [Halobacillus halophilus]|uniref:Transmembrane protein n=1 Tax=Halobacillus halophilus (strain ATCC 35676 / DSM 2266 / JCM 20832 / KCTC 3685 / LMG 17431 / NBRC 102448 / NCIMB 2269) TaxID=866895 RepID=I0JSD8_HALH3|nr:permease prefix domain 1-containing protein [Halobacillus halophilus]ASF40996.1 hypothetical protein CEH05_18260 [Halobacillus halophilus]CCG47060.1 hypothetical protein HBHAL_4722 [Halobacillus halophilus DSM 2266]